MNRARIITLFQPLADVTDEIIARFDGDPGLLLPNSRANGPDRWRVSVHAGPVEREVDMTIGDVWLWSEGRWRSLSWEPLGGYHEFVPVERFLPSFVGELGLQVDNKSLVLTGAYHPPLGAVGTVVDAAALHVVARATARQLLGEIALQLAQPASV